MKYYCGVTGLLLKVPRLVPCSGRLTLPSSLGVGFEISPAVPLVVSWVSTITGSARILVVLWPSALQPRATSGHSQPPVDSRNARPSGQLRRLALPFSQLQKWPHLVGSSCEKSPFFLGQWIDGCGSSANFFLLTKVQFYVRISFQQWFKDKYDLWLT